MISPNLDQEKTQKTKPNTPEAKIEAERKKTLTDSNQDDIDPNPTQPPPDPIDKEETDKKPPDPSDKDNKKESNLTILGSTAYINGSANHSYTL